MIKGYAINNVLVTGGCGFIGSNFLEKSCKKFPNIHFTNVDNLSYAVSKHTDNELSKNKNYTFELLDITDATAAESEALELI